MKTLDKMTNTEKATLLFGLFPDEIPALIESTMGMLEAFKLEEPQMATLWDSGLLAPDFRAKILNDTHQKITQYGKRMYRNKKLFAGQLFDGYIIFCSVYCLKAYAVTRKMYNPKLTTAVDLLYNL